MYYNQSWYRLRPKWLWMCLHGCCLRSAPARSGASQFAPWASAAVSHETRYHTKCHIQPETREVVHASCRRQLLHSVADNGLFHMDAACGRRPLAQVLRNSLSGHPPLSSTTRDTITNAIYSQRREGPSRQRVSPHVLCCDFCLLAHLVRPGQGYRHTVRCYDYMSDNLADDFVILNRRNALVIK